MDASFLSKQQSAEKKYKHFRITSDAVKKSATDGQLEFFYIGKDIDKISFLIKTFDCGYSAEDARMAIFLLNRIADNAIIPDIIIVDHSIGEKSLRELVHYASDSQTYATIPFVLDASGLTQIELAKYRTIHYLDDIIFLTDNDSRKLKTKTEFLKKIKNSPNPNVNGEPFTKIFHVPFEMKNLVKRTFDITVSFLLIALLSPLFILIALAIKLESSGPVLYVSKRAGKGYQIFDFFKFRTMIMDADKKIEQLSHLNHYNDHEENGSVFFKVVNDSRITRVGAFLRRTSMDELPQFFNVFLGNMSFVGNRPLPLYEAAKLTTDDWAERFMAPAGITGLWQIKKSEQGYISMEERIDLDITYSKNYNFMYDLWIMAKTPSALIQKSNT